MAGFQVKTAIITVLYSMFGVPMPPWSESALSPLAIRLHEIQNGIQPVGEHCESCNHSLGKHNLIDNFLGLIVVGFATVGLPKAMTYVRNPFFYFISHISA
jgi:hypothetical protein